MNEMDCGLKKMNEMDYGLKEIKMKCEQNVSDRRGVGVEWLCNYVL